MLEDSKYANYDCIIKNNDLEYCENDILANKPIYSLESRQYEYTDSDVRNFKITRENCYLQTKISVFIDNEDDGILMTLEEFLDKFSIHPSKREHTYNCVNIDFTFMELGKIFKSIDFIIRNDLCMNNWPEIYKISQPYYVNDYGEIDNLILPLTHQVCTISKKECFTDFHMDFSGASVWVTVLKGKKVWWLILPTGYNIRLCEHYIKDTYSQKESLIELVEENCRITLMERQSLLLPGG
uniref:JmjC domain-containing protein n=1 Tax=Strongyloides papillosus TaxID=174720 RepID=A0A0N5BMG7_STREA